MSIEYDGEHLIDPEGVDRVVVVERIEGAQALSYTPVAKAECTQCRSWCWLGNGTYRLVTQSKALPLCQTCSAEILHPDRVVGWVEND